MSHRFRRIEYYIIDRPDKNWKWLYSAKEGEEELNALITNQKLQGLYISLSGYLNSASDCKNLIDLSCWGGSSLLVFENIVFINDQAEYMAGVGFDKNEALDLMQNLNKKSIAITSTLSYVTELQDKIKSN